MSRWVLAAGVLSIPLLLLLGSTRAQPAEATIQVQMFDFKSDQGQVLLALFNEGKGFPGKFHQATKRGVTRLKNRKASYEFKVKPGTWAIAVVHDENKNGKMDTNWIGIPKEGYGASRDPRPRVGAPDFDDAKFAAKAGKNLLKIHMLY